MGRSAAGETKAQQHKRPTTKCTSVCIIYIYIYTILFFIITLHVTLPIIKNLYMVFLTKVIDDSDIGNICVS